MTNYLHSRKNLDDRLNDLIVHIAYADQKQCLKEAKKMRKDLLAKKPKEKKGNYQDVLNRAMATCRHGYLLGSCRMCSFELEKQSSTNTPKKPKEEKENIYWESRDNSKLKSHYKIKGDTHYGDSAKFTTNHKIEPIREIDGEWYTSKVRAKNYGEREELLRNEHNKLVDLLNSEKK